MKLRASFRQHCDIFMKSFSFLLRSANNLQPSFQIHNSSIRVSQARTEPFRVLKAIFIFGLVFHSVLLREELGDRV